MPKFKRRYPTIDVMWRIQEENDFMCRAFYAFFLLQVQGGINYQLFTQMIALGRHGPHPKRIVGEASEKRLPIRRPCNRNAFGLPSFIGDFVRGFELVND